MSTCRLANVSLEIMKFYFWVTTYNNYLRVCFFYNDKKPKISSIVKDFFISFNLYLIKHFLRPCQIKGYKYFLLEILSRKLTRYGSSGLTSKGVVHRVENKSFRYEFQAHPNLDRNWAFKRFILLRLHFVSLEVKTLL